MREGAPSYGPPRLAGNPGRISVDNQAPRQGVEVILAARELAGPCERAHGSKNRDGPVKSSLMGQNSLPSKSKKTLTRNRNASSKHKSTLSLSPFPSAKNREKEIREKKFATTTGTDANATKTFFGPSPLFRMFHVVCVGIVFFLLSQEIAQNLLSIFHQKINRSFNFENRPKSSFHFNAANS